MPDLPLNQLVAHPLASNTLTHAARASLKAHLASRGHCPPLIVRPLAPGANGARYQLMDGHQRAGLLRELGHTHAPCAVWPVDDQQALLLLATLNTLRGSEDPICRGRLLTALGRTFAIADLARRLPDSARRIAGLMRLASDSGAGPPAPSPRATRRAPAARSSSRDSSSAPSRPNDASGPAYFFLSPASRAALDAALSAMGGTREEALMRLLRRAAAFTRHHPSS